jgi:hypothetical protein
MGKTTHDILVLVVVAREAGNHHDDGIAPGFLGTRIVGGDARAPHVQLDVARYDALSARHDGLGQGDPRGKHAPHRRKGAESQDFSAAQRIEHGPLFRDW